MDKIEYDLFGHKRRVHIKGTGMSKPDTNRSPRRKTIHLINNNHYLGNGDRKQGWRRTHHILVKYIHSQEQADRLNYGHRVNNWKLKLAVKTMHEYKNLTPNQRKNSSRSIAKIADEVGISKPTLYRAYYKKYGK